MEFVRPKAGKIPDRVPGNVSVNLPQLESCSIIRLTAPSQHPAARCGHTAGGRGTWWREGAAPSRRFLSRHAGRGMEIALSSLTGGAWWSANVLPNLRAMSCMVREDRQAHRMAMLPRGHSLLGLAGHPGVGVPPFFQGDRAGSP